jgi:tryptophan synthase alpha chain
VDEVEKMLPRIRQHVHIPVGVGFGIRDAQTAQAIGRSADSTKNKATQLGLIK